jgi:hypothetical protein
MTKKEVSEQFAKLTKFGYKVINFNSYKAMPTQMKNFVDHLIFNKKYFIAVEVKIGKDELSDGQKDTAEKLSSVMAINKTFYYFNIKTLPEAKNLCDKILGNKL